MVPDETFGEEPYPGSEEFYKQDVCIKNAKSRKEQEQQSGEKATPESTKKDSPNTKQIKGKPKAKDKLSEDK